MTCIGPPFPAQPIPNVVVVAAVICAVLTYPLTRLRGHYFAIATVAIWMIAQPIGATWEYIGGSQGLFIPVKPRPNVTVTQAQEAVTIALRESRRLRPADHNSFDMVTQDQILDTFNKISGVFFLVMIALSSVALLVGGIGVMAVMMISVTDRTREIGIRKAVGATRRDILQQFLIEAAALTGTGGVKEVFHNISKPLEFRRQIEGGAS